ncbi:carotenoid 1,2-hydratase [Limnobacter humi]|uniref:Carotenoid 1,2-hydratase n=1 Tax=Limnobacter humi TaxID=1778671 RepID=A0ABT1WHX2_9BURK|nr:lipocalin-like domain-containing protein [Limnobacter humi]MCQ8897123.1 carotenoid 1,2-hydratase [Limnobacter humi]
MMMNRRTCLQFLAAAGVTVPLANPALGRANRLYDQPRADLTPQLPRDHGPHPGFRTEWWYFTGWFNSPGLASPLGLQITFFRSSPEVDVDNPSRFNPSQLLFAHAAVAMPSQGHLVHAQTIRRAGSGLSAIRNTPAKVLDLQMPGWTLSSQNGDAWQCHIQAQEMSLMLQMAQTQTPWFQGNNGYSRKGPGETQSSYYITLPHLKSSGTVQVDGKTLPVEGSFWMDHEWSSTVLAPDAQGWDWVGLQGTAGESLMAFQIRPKPVPGKMVKPIWTHAALRNAQGQVHTFNTVEFQTLQSWTSPRTGVVYPVEQVLILDRQRFHVKPMMPDQELDARTSTGTLYWEGAVTVETTGRQRWGHGYLEMTGYDRPMTL